MEQGELERLRSHYADLSDEDLTRAHRAGREGFREPAIWDIVAAEYTRRVVQGGLQDSASPESEPATAYQDESSYKGVSGWLFLLCVVLTIISPVATLAAIVTGFRQASPQFDQVPGLGVVAGIDTIVTVVLMAFSVYAGIGLWTLRPGAVQMAKRYLWCFLGYQALATVVTLMLWLPADGDVGFEIAVESIRSVVFFAVWYSYLSTSKRVRATYA